MSVFNETVCNKTLVNRKKMLLLESDLSLQAAKKLQLLDLYNS